MEEILGECKEKIRENNIFDSHINTDLQMSTEYSDQGDDYLDKTLSAICKDLTSVNNNLESLLRLLILRKEISESELEIPFKVVKNE